MACTQTFQVSDRSSPIFHHNYSYFASPFCDALAKKKFTNAVNLLELWVQLQLRSHPPVLTEELLCMQKACFYMTLFYLRKLFFSI